MSRSWALFSNMPAGKIERRLKLNSLRKKDNVQRSNVPKNHPLLQKARSEHVQVLAREE